MTQFLYVPHVTGRGQGSSLRIDGSMIARGVEAPSRVSRDALLTVALKPKPSTKGKFGGAVKIANGQVTI
jgi:hypothetical protein